MISEKSKASEKTILDRSNTAEKCQTLEKLDIISMAPKRKPSNRKRLRARPKNSSATSLARLAKSTSESYERTDTPEFVPENIAPKTLYTDRQQKPVPVEVVSPVPAQVEAQKAVESDSDLTPDELEEPPRAEIEVYYLLLSSVFNLKFSLRYQQKIIKKVKHLHLSKKQKLSRNLRKKLRMKAQRKQNQKQK